MYPEIGLFDAKAKFFELLREAKRANYVLLVVTGTESLVSVH
jgi:hypothetical protein